MAKMTDVDLTIIQIGYNHPFTDDEARRVLLKVIRTMKEEARRRGDTETLETLEKAGDENEIVEKIIAARKKLFDQE